MTFVYDEALLFLESSLIKRYFFVCLEEHLQSFDLIRLIEACYLS